MELPIYMYSLFINGLPLLTVNQDYKSQLPKTCIANGFSD